MDIDKEAFGRRLREERQRLGYSQEDFAEAGGVRRVAQFLYEKGDRTPNVDYVTRLLGKGLDLHYLFFGDSTQASSLFAMEEQALTEAFRLTDELCRDNKGRMLEYEYRQTLFLAIINMVSAQPKGRRNWASIKARARQLLEAA